MADTHPDYDHPIETVEALRKITRKQLLKRRGCGRITVDEIEATLGPLAAP
jgi:hypothetical protein